MLSRVDERIPCTQAICVVHTRELARQIHATAMKLAHYIPTMRIDLLIPELQSQGARSEITGHVVVATPGKLSNALRSHIIRPDKFCRVCACGWVGGWVGHYCVVRTDSRQKA